MKTFEPRTFTLVLGAALSALAFSAGAASNSPNDSSMPSHAPAGSPDASSTSNFSMYDTNGDGIVTQEEYTSRGGDEKTFSKADTNHDKRLTSEEFAKGNAKMNKSGAYGHDAWITAKVKTMLLKDEGIKGLKVDVETHDGIVQLTGAVKSAEQIERAGKVAAGVEGVKSVRNELQMQPQG